MILAIKQPLFSVSAAGWQAAVCDGCPATDRMDSSVTGGGSSLTWNWAAPSQVGPKWDWRTAPGGTWCLAQWEERNENGKVHGPCHLLWPPVSFLCLNKELDLVGVWSSLQTHSQSFVGYIDQEIIPILYGLLGWTMQTLFWFLLSSTFSYSTTDSRVEKTVNCQWPELFIPLIMNQFQRCQSLRNGAWHKKVK